MSQNNNKEKQETIPCVDGGDDNDDDNDEDYVSTTHHTHLLDLCSSFHQALTVGVQSFGLIIPER